MQPVRGVAQATTINRETADIIQVFTEGLTEQLWPIAIRIHSKPEVAWNEHYAVGELTDYLASNSFSIERSFCDLETSFRAFYDLPGEGPTVTFLAEYDALPDLGHACGHNLIGTAAAGAAVALARAALRSGLGGRVEVVGTPAEEGGGGKIILVERGAFSGSDVAMMFHPSARSMPIRGALAACRLNMKFFGKAAHAASFPHLGVNAFDACRLTFNAIDAMRQHLPDETRIHGMIRDRGAALNVVPDSMVAEFSVRHRRIEQLQEIKAKVRRCAEGAALAVGATVEIEEDLTYSERKNNHELALRFGGYLQALGEPVVDPPALGGVGSSDFGNVSQVVPAIHSYIRIVPEGVTNHTKEFAEAAASEDGRRGMELAVKALSMTGFDVLNDPSFLARIKEEFASGN